MAYVRIDMLYKQVMKKLLPGVGKTKMTQKITRCSMFLCTNRRSNPKYPGSNYYFFAAFKLNMN